MKDAHAGMKLGDVEFDAIVELLERTMLEMEVDKELVNEVKQSLEPLR